MGFGVFMPKMKMFRQIIMKIFIFIAVIAAMTGMLAAVSMIPKAQIRENVRESAEFLCSDDPFPYAVEGIKGSCLDRYADAILFNIIYSYDSGEPFQSVMRSSYYFQSDREETENLLEAVTGDKAPNRQYLRYWHGSAVLLRPLLCIFSIRQIYLLNAVLLFALLLWFIIISLKAKDYLLSIGMAVSMLLVRIWFVPFCLEYTWVFLIMSIASLTAFKLGRKQNPEKLTTFLMLVGMVTNFFDFLTAETVTLVIPLLIILYLQKKEHGADRLVGLAVKGAAAWLAGYALTWVSKWLVAAVILRENVMLYVSGHIAQRIGEDLGIGTFRYLTGALTKNFGCLFPLGYGVIGIIGFALILIVAAYPAFVYFKKDPEVRVIFIYAASGCIPLIRFLLLHNHSYLHFFFTYRALSSTVFAAALLIGELIFGGEHEKNG